jgi:large subunit ribosomal protein L34
MGFSHRMPRKSLIKRRRQVGFRSRMKTRAGRKMINRRRRLGRKLTVVKRR